MKLQMHPTACAAPLGTVIYPASMPLTLVLYPTAAAALMPIPQVFEWQP